MLAAAASGQAKHHPVYPGTRTVRRGHREPLWAGVGAYGVRDSVKMNNHV